MARGVQARATQSLTYKKRRTDNLKLNGFAFQFNSANLEVYTNCADIALCVGVVGETKKQTRLQKGEMAQY